ncbi:MAG: flagellar hook-associated protein FlgL [Ignavibacteriae bacterium]|nr:flagellar hook-associated protein FlgL [Ignavibacteriota bacterium]
MRITQNTFTKNYLLNINNARARMSRLQDQLSTGKKVLNASDDPEAANRILRIKNIIAKHEQFAANVSDGETFSQATTSALDRFSDMLVEAKDILSRARNGSRVPDLQTFANQIDQLISDVVQTANTTFNGKYLFGGTQTTEAPFILAADRSAVTTNPNGITGEIRIIVDEGRTQVVNIDGQQAFQGTAIFQTLIQIRNDMQNGLAPTAAQLDAVTAHLDYVASQAGKSGLIMSALEMDGRYLDERSTELESLLSLDQDTDFAEATMQLKKEELMLDAALSVGARIIPKTLMDFLR